MQELLNLARFRNDANMVEKEHGLPGNIGFVRLSGQIANFINGQKD